MGHFPSDELLNIIKFIHSNLGLKRTLKLIFRIQSEDNIGKNNIEKLNSDAHMSKATDEREIYSKTSNHWPESRFFLCQFFEYLLIIVILKA